MDRYYLTEDGTPEREVTKPEFVRAERAAGFINTLGQRDEPATAGFNGFTATAGAEVRGRVVHEIAIGRRSIPDQLGYLAESSARETATGQPWRSSWKLSSTSCARRSGKREGNEHDRATQ